MPIAVEKIDFSSYLRQRMLDMFNKVIDTEVNYHLGQANLKPALQSILQLSQGKAFVVIDKQVWEKQENYIKEAFSGAQAVFYKFCGGEKNKNLAEIQKIYEAMLEAKTDRSIPTIAIGGGITGDMTGFAASTFMRGTPFIQVPTSLLAMVDSSVGGKNGFDLPKGKNLVGTFYNPKRIIADINFLQTLPENEWSNGFAEILKTALLDTGSLLKKLEGFCQQNFNHSNNHNSEISLSDKIITIYNDKNFITNLIESSVKTKIFIVSSDPFDLGKERYKLNLGHTFAHSLEVSCDYKLAHGQAVAIGIICALLLSDSLKILEEPIIARMKRLICFWGLPTTIPQGLEWEEFAKNLNSDKKRQGGRNVFVLPLSEGKVIQSSDVDLSHIKKVFDSLSVA